MSYSCADFYDDVMNAAERLLTPAERRRLNETEGPAPGADAILRILRAIPTPKPVKRSKQVYQNGDDRLVEDALMELRRALKNLKLAGAVKTAERVRHAISSAKGAVRAVGYRRGQDTNRRRMEEGTL